ncbi:hypothetical protein TNCV_4201341 [Trichonephila clavipes]|uniref:Uncharacterized protein n=1 Tax=Trichonephila clavipes TaxID=2585209 RepID=A0A8X6WBS1_TRICX|nr:hypothetical protein TNCV_4201341 [Trichonephila clavipes]
MKDERWRIETRNTNAEEYRLFFITNDDPRIEQKGAFHARRESISGESPTCFPEDTSLPCSGFEPEPTRLQAEGHNHHTGWAATESAIRLQMKS